MPNGKQLSPRGTASEHEHQSALFRWAGLARAALPDLEMLAAVPNGGLRHKATAGRLKREGVQAGYPDILLDVARRPYHGLRIELKALGGRLESSQREWGARLARHGYLCLVCHGWDAARDAIEEYLRRPAWTTQGSADA